MLVYSLEGEQSPSTAAGPQPLPFPARTKGAQQRPVAATHEHGAVGREAAGANGDVLLRHELAHLAVRPQVPETQRAPQLGRNEETELGVVANGVNLGVYRHMCTRLALRAQGRERRNRVVGLLRANETALTGVAQVMVCMHLPVRKSQTLIFLSSHPV
jgi:hypothetical protein